MKAILSIAKYALILSGVGYLLMLGSLHFLPSGLSCTNYPMLSLPSPDASHVATAYQEVCDDGKLKTVVSISGDFPASSVGQRMVVFKAESSVISDIGGDVKPLNFAARWLTSNQLQITIPDKNVVFLTKQSSAYGIDIVYVEKS